MQRCIFPFDLNRRVPNGTHGGVRGVVDATPTRFPYSCVACTTPVVVHLNRAEARSQKSRLSHLFKYNINVIIRASCRKKCSTPLKHGNSLRHSRLKLKRNFFVPFQYCHGKGCCMRPLRRRWRDKKDFMRFASRMHRVSIVSFTLTKTKHPMCGC